VWAEKDKRPGSVSRLNPLSDVVSLVNSCKLCNKGDFICGYTFRPSGTLTFPGPQCSMEFMVGLASNVRDPRRKIELLHSLDHVWSRLTVECGDGRATAEPALRFSRVGGLSARSLYVIGKCVVAIFRDIVI
jgi:hypothetical protein